MGICCQRDIKLRFPPYAEGIKFSNLSPHAILDNVREYYEFIKVIGYGQFGTVREAIKMLNAKPLEISNEAARGKHYAVKSISKDRVLKETESLRRELEILQIVDHPNIIKMYEIYEDKKYIHIVMELCTGGDLFDYLLLKGTLNEMEVATIMKKLMLGVKHLHRLNVCHRDLKPENFMLSHAGPDAEIKIIDFGMSIKFTNNQMSTMVGTPYYLAPEMMHETYGKECDYWSLGVIMYFLLVGKHPFIGVNVNDVFMRISRGHFSFSHPKWANISSEAKDLISRLLVLDPAQRYNMSQALMHPWFQRFMVNQPEPVNLNIFNSLKNYKARGKLWQETMKLVVKNLSEEQISELHNAFMSLDSANQGYITAIDIEQAMIRQGHEIFLDDFHNMIRNIDYIGKGKLNYTEFIVAVLDRKKILNEEIIWDVFKKFDLNNEEKIGVKELKTALEVAGCSLNSNDFNEIVNEFQLKAGEFMDFAHFKEIMMCFSEDNSMRFSLGTEESPRNSVRRLSKQRLSIRRVSRISERRSSTNSKVSASDFPVCKTMT
ncbi:unnamed protein product [Blepharisma stoltei]|uniref:Calcium-dependent protein kinase n=1 Tax=Blepharisma stoltei TaxID=1481888 RepID=A0AAU9IB58_9CILI|nr:unnamed protein product [Blepharisma stoltei]